MTRIVKALNIVKSNFMLVAIVSLAGIWLKTDSRLLDIMFFVSFLLFAVALPMLYGRCIESIRNDKQRRMTDLLGSHLLNFWIVSIILLIPVMIASPLLDVMAYQSDKKIVGLAIGTVVNVLAIYILPAAFLNRINFNAVPLGIKFLLANVRKSLVLILLTIVVFTIKINAYIIAFHWLPVPGEDVWIVFSIGYISNILSLSITLVVFSMASMELLDHAPSGSICEV